MRSWKAVILSLLLVAGCDQQKTIDQAILNIKDPNTATRQAAAFDLAKIGSEANRAVPELARALYDSEWSVRYSSAYALSRIGSAEANSALEAVLPDYLALLKGGEIVDRISVAEALGYFGPSGEKALPDLLAVESESEKLAAMFEGQYEKQKTQNPEEAQGYRDNAKRLRWLMGACSVSISKLRPRTGK